MRYHAGRMELNEIANLRAAHNPPLTVRDLAKLARTSGSHITRVENGQQDITLGTLRKIATALGVAPTEVFPTLAKATDQLTPAEKEAMNL